MTFAEYMTRVVITLVALVYPGYRSYKAINAAEAAKTAWLQYWLVLSVISGLMLIIEPLLSERVPLWPVCKIAVVIFLVHPKTKGYEKIYAMALEPQLRNYEATIDETVDNMMVAGEAHARKIGPQVKEMYAKTRQTIESKLNKKTS